LQVTPRGRLRLYCQPGLNRFIALVANRLLADYPEVSLDFSHRRHDRSRAGGVRPGDYAGITA
jgi:DNA-binding transcriptional LysR family regulator